MYAGRAVVGMPDHRLVGECENLALVVRYSRNGRWRQKYIESPKNIESEGIRRPRATFGSSKMANGSLLYQVQLAQYILEY